ncbi:head-tail connector protein [Mangrovicella endophytica]|uniref:head-tail connector protein n=1 Tax=Mangrovicella endophytica TaxID=2066697 RepID=UPI001300148A|nr:head-tail connector protein [Mangrovicella endophytica]
MTLIDLGGDGGEPLDLADLKSWCRIERSDEDTLLTELIRSARETVEAETGLVLMPRSFRVSLDAAPFDGWCRLPRRPLRSVTSVIAYDAGGNARLFGTADYRLTRNGDAAAIRMGRSVLAAASNGLEIEFEAGFAEGAAPASLILAMKRIAATAYELRSAVAPEQQPAVIPAAARELLAPFRPVRL